MEHKPTEEQQAIREAFATGDNLVVEAGAGSGKTSTLEMLANDAPRRNGLYLAYNRAIKEDALLRFPRSVTCKTSHGLAYRTHATPYKHRIRGAHVPAAQAARILGVREPFRLTADGPMLQPNSIAIIARETVARFCHSADREITRRHVPLVNGFDTPTDRAALAAFILPYANRAWADLNSPNGQLRFIDDVYLKMFQLSDPVIDADYLLVDEAQDLNPVVKAIVEKQQAQIVYVGDRCQAIYQWRGAVDAMETATGKRLYLSQSFRFGEAIAAEANKWLTVLNAELRLRGFDQIPSVVKPLAQPDAVLCRTNAEALASVMRATQANIKVGLVGGGGEIRALAKAAADLKAGRPTEHPQLMAFSTWAEVQDYVDHDSSGSDLKVLVKMVDDHGADTLIATMNRVCDEADAQLVVSTAHKAKGREWNRVQIASDFRAPRKTEDDPDPEINPEEARLAYVAVTRAQLVLDRDGLAWVDSYVDATPALFPVIEPAAVRGPAEETAPVVPLATAAEPVQEPFPVGAAVRYRPTGRTFNRTVFTVVDSRQSETAGERIYALAQPNGRVQRGIRGDFLMAAEQPSTVVDELVEESAPEVAPEPKHCWRCGNHRCWCDPAEKAFWEAIGGGVRGTTADAVEVAIRTRRVAKGLPV